ncbi:hypothetical protein RND71_008996 [Anisodus tanguticus]|uniref:RNA helicase n=1 Tax=Anisodus tanguticus TaxID=243964 RepID=A0AAE1VLL9_9SOLA|nr:hypothetical protein RND71_008996 [Anisodus tanguticus]
MYSQHSCRPSTHRPYRPGCYSSNSELDRPPGSLHKPPNFVIELRSGNSSNRRINRYELNALIEKLPFCPRNLFVFTKGFVLGSLSYDQWSETLEVIVELWRMRLVGDHSFTPWVNRNVEVPSDEFELKDRVKIVFLEKLKGLLVKGEMLEKWEKKLGLVSDEINELLKLLKNRNSLRVCNEILKKREGLEKERDLIRKRIEEFKRGIECIIQEFEEKGFEDDEGLRVIKIGREFDWDRVHCLMTRECRRLDDGLPIFAFREQILGQIHYQQVTVLIGETGSGKSTQLVQFLADCGITGNGSIVCTQPRKLAANSLAQRVEQESEGCYEDTSIVCYPSYSSGHKFDSKVVFMTDHCLLQHYMVDKTLSKISCIIIDEAHERSLNTDLLLALIKNLLLQRFDLRLVIMSATADADQLADYFFGCRTFHVSGRTFPVDIKYVPCESTGCLGVGPISSYVYDVVKVVTEIHETEGEGTILAFLTSQIEVEWACEKCQASSAVVLPLHGKLSCEEQHRVFLSYPGKRKVIFTTNVAETSLTIPGVKYVVDSGMVKESRFDPGTCMSILRICNVSQSSAKQRAGRAGRTEPGTCYRLEWEAVSKERKNAWCWDNSINAKSIRRCQETVQEFEACLQSELNTIIASYWRWDPQVHTEHDETLKSIILSSLAENVAMYSGYDQLGYEVALSGKYIQLHPSCSLLNFDRRPTWVVFGEILAAAKEYLICVTAFEFSSLSTLSPSPLFNFLEMDAQKLEKKVLTGFGSMLLKRFCGKSNSSVNNLVSRIRTKYMDERIGIQVNFDKNEVLLYASSSDMESVSGQVTDALEYESKLLQNECLEKCLFSGGSAASALVALFGAGAIVKHLELKKRFLAVDIFHSNTKAVDDKELLVFLERNTSGDICAVQKSSGMGHDNEENRWGRFSSVLRARVNWPRRCSNGVGIVKCEPNDVAFMVNDFSRVMIGGLFIRSKSSNKFFDSVVISGLNTDLSEPEIFEVLSAATDRKILDFFLVRGNAVENPPAAACEEALRREISPLMPKKLPFVQSVRVQVFQPEPKDTYMRAAIIFDGSLHLEAAQALEHIDGKVLSGCLPWQKIRCQQLFHSSVSCPAPVYRVIKNQLDSLLARLQRREGVECNLERNENGSYRVKISATATKIVAELRRPLEQLMKGKIVDHVGISPTVVQLLFSREGTNIMQMVQQETGTYILFDRHRLSVRIFGSSDKIDMAERRFVNSLLALHESKQLEVHLRGGLLPLDLMKRVVRRFGPDLNGLKLKVPDAEFSLNTRRHCISIKGTKEMKQKVEEIISEIAQTSDWRMDDEADCPICLCELEDAYRLEGCNHFFCRSCLLEQCESAIRSREGFPLLCMLKGCGTHILVSDLRSLLSSEKLEELFRASLGAFVAASGGRYRFCPSPDCPSVYHVAESGEVGVPFACGACYVETCTSCHLEYHPYISCDKYKEFKDDPDFSLKEWCKGKENVKNCPVCGFTIEKVDGCNHIECRCGKHVCWVCLVFFSSSDDCYNHLRSIHQAII